MSEKRDLGLGTGALIGALLTASLLGVMFLARQAADLSFVPYDVFNWMARELPGGLVTFGIDLMIDTMRLLGISVVDTAKTAERVMAIIQFLLVGTVTGVLFFAFMKMRQVKATMYSGLIIGALLGLPMTAIALSITQSTASWLVNALWLIGLFLIWGISLSYACKRLEAIKGAGKTVALDMTEDEPAIEEALGEQIDLEQKAVSSQCPVGA